ncbi:MAG TPA: hypothetical protein VFP95_04225, partial [Gammaproteobacteria bacterium]|nr:hypothetical protein [Gammaproteobacteria bacterium]
MTTNQAQQDLAYIREVMSQTRRFTQMSGNHLILWGFLISFGLLAIWFLDNTAYDFWLGIIWTIIGVGGGLFSAWLGHREQRQMQMATWAGKLIGHVWLACGVGFAVQFAGYVTGTLPSYTGPGLAALLTGIGVYLSGVLSGIGWLRNTAFLWWAAAVLMLIKPGYYTLLLFVALLML